MPVQDHHMPVHLEMSGRLHVAAAPDRAFVFFTPEGERLYVAGWDPEYLHPTDGALGEGLVFRTRHGGETTLWLVARCHLAETFIEYVRVVPDSRIGTVSVRLSPAAGGGADVAVSYRLTSLSPAGDGKIRAFAAGFDAMLASWQQSIADGLARDGVPRHPQAR